MYSYTEPREAVLEYTTWLLATSNDWQPVLVAEGKRQGKTIIARLEGFDDRDQAATLVGRTIGVPRDALPDTGEGQYYWSDLEGLRVVDRDGAELGKVRYLIETGANDVMVVKGEQERLIPFVSGDTVVDVDLVNGVIIVDWEWD